MPDLPAHVRVAIVGAGFAGLATAIRLTQEGEDDFVVLERAHEVGGVWRENRYPGAACDVESRLYELDAAPNPDWSRRFAGGEEIGAYLRGLVGDFELGPHLALGTELEAARWDEDAARWRLDTSRGALTADVLVAAPGALAEPRLPDLPGLDTFEGPAFHTAQWDESVDLDGQRVAVIGTGASAIQVVPGIQPRVGRLTLYQRTPAWVIPRRDKALSPRVRRLLRRVPLVRKALRGSLYVHHEALGFVFRHVSLARVAGHVLGLHLRRQVKDPALRETLRPDDTLGCRRVLLSDDYYPALTQPNVEVVAGGAVEVRPGGVVGADGVERPADVVVFATGFYATEFPFAEHLVGADGRTLGEVWGASPKAHLGTTVAGFPNLFVLQGPNTGLGHSSVLLMAEAQIEHLVNALAFLDRPDVAAVEPRPEAQAAFVADVDAQMERTVWLSGCESWYLDETGRNAALWPGGVGAFRRRVGPFDESEYRLHPAPAPVHA
ncbi:NAD(P)/FAD-dependent oxidoreductase [Rubrivirga sp. S365]|uniref:NAD(P)/FAD-dependent oxidoreductase n=1 Tax=Rubrivirga litoralis TaxID=3075598 RepID=A0ABU3BSV7_9BACT|nr:MULTISPECIES: NAD(P)/FAD-dependent oxidoreductase [unclassified Rubrivirga]MDT0632372.1 NAD(P)/FAD-dependent oxidoreductase [Rubrivirga sp. F394]MDT7857338.1 NAD(P)/FAD-dependent oxidoreductase [Rubrivirga sp. S365]